MVLKVLKCLLTIGGQSRLNMFYEVLQFAALDDEERSDPMVRIFPKVTKCTFHNYGVSGSIQE